MLSQYIIKFAIVKILLIKYCIISFLLITISCQNKNDSIIKIKKSVTALNDSNISGNISVTSENISGKSSVTIEAHLFGLKPGESSIHIHEFADCSSIDGLSSGGHWNPTLESHGKWGDSKGFHRGDIGNFNVDENGNGTVSFSTDLWCLDCDDLNKNIIGKSIIIHQGSDDLVSQPSGAAGSRIACGGIIEENL